MLFLVVLFSFVAFLIIYIIVSYKQLYEVLYPET